jgi:hypothetical protein
MKRICVTCEGNASDSLVLEGKVIQALRAEVSLVLRRVLARPQYVLDVLRRLDMADLGLGVAHQTDPTALIVMGDPEWKFVSRALGEVLVRLY